jgi:sugar-phosphatase
MPPPLPYAAGLPGPLLDPMGGRVRNHQAVGIRPKTLMAGDDITRGKPDPEPYLLAARRLGVDPAHCVVFEDAPAGLKAGRAAGMTTVALATTHRAEELRADLVVENLSALSALVTDHAIEISVRG